MELKKNDPAKRSKMMNFALNDKEYEFFMAYMKKYKIENRSRWMRETMLNQMHKNLDKDYPTLFDENEMRR